MLEESEIDMNRDGIGREELIDLLCSFSRETRADQNDQTKEWTREACVGDSKQAWNVF
jgi:hypothetical protein